MLTRQTQHCKNHASLMHPTPLQDICQVVANDTHWQLDEHAKSMPGSKRNILASRGSSAQHMQRNVMILAIK